MRSLTAEVYAEAEAFPLPDTQCLYTAPDEQVCFGHNRPTRLRLLPGKPLVLGFHPQGWSQLSYLVPGPDAPPVPDAGAQAIATAIQQGAARQHDIIAQAEQRRLMLSFLHDDQRLEEGEERTPKTGARPYLAAAATGTRTREDDNATARVRPDDDVLLG